MTEKEHRMLPNISERMLEENRQAGYNHGYAVGYNEAIDDFVKAIDETDREDCLVDDMLRIEQIAEQLKAGGNA